MLFATTIRDEWSRSRIWTTPARVVVRGALEVTVAHALARSVGCRPSMDPAHPHGGGRQEEEAAVGSAPWIAGATKKKNRSYAVADSTSNSHMVLDTVEAAISLKMSLQHCCHIRSK